MRLDRSTDVAMHVYRLLLEKLGLVGASQAVMGSDEVLALLLARGESCLDENRPGSGHVPTTRLVAGDADEVAEQLKPFVEMGYRHLICGFPAPYDEETMRRLATEVRPALEALV